MKRRNFLKVTVAMGAALAAPEFLSRISAQTTSSTTSSAADSITSSGRLLFFLPEKIAVFQNQIAADPAAKARWEKLLRDADGLAGGKRVRIGVNPQEPASKLLGLAWRVTRDERYAKTLRNLLLREAGAVDWTGDNVIGRTPPWHSWLGTAASVVACAIGREALGAYLSKEEQRQITDSMIRLGVLPLLEDWLLPQQRIHALDSMGHNWWSVCVSGAGIGALALLNEDKRAPEWILRVDAALAGFFDYRGMVLLNKPETFDPAGGFYESVNYAAFAMESYLLYRLARMNAIRESAPQAPVLQCIGEFFAQTSYPASDGDFVVNFGDSVLRPRVAPTMQLLSAQTFSREICQWYLERRPEGYNDPIGFLYQNTNTAKVQNSLPNSILYPKIGWAVLRDSWNEDATLLGVKCGFTWNHAHADAGSFVLYHAGQPLLIDSGSCHYDSPKYLDYYCQSRAHNVVLFNGQGQPSEDFHERGVKFPGHVHDLIDDLGMKYIYADATGPMARYFKRNYRHWLWLDGVIVIFDDILAHEAGQFDWLLHYAGEAKISGTTVELSNGSAKGRFQMIYPGNPEIKQETGLAPERPDQKRSYLRFSPPLKSRVQKFITTIIPESSSNQPSPTIESIKANDALGVRITNGKQATDIYLNLQSDGRRMHLNSNNVIDGWETDAYLLALTHSIGTAVSDPENISRFFMVDCSYLRRNGQSIVDSFSKITAVFQPGENPQITLRGQPLLEVDLFAPQEPSLLQVNEKQTPFRYESKRRILHFSLDESKIA